MPRNPSIGSRSGDPVAPNDAPVAAPAQNVNPAVTALIDHWSKAEASERANSQSFIIGLTKLLGVEPPSNDHADGYSFEHPVKLYSGHAETTGFVDLGGRFTS